MKNESTYSLDEIPLREDATYLNINQAKERYCRRKKDGEDTDLEGFYFDLIALKKFIYHLDKFNDSKIIVDGNSRNRTKDEMVTGVRIWKAKSKSDIYSPKKILLAEGEWKEDLLITPTLNDYRDIHATDLGLEAKDENGLLLILSNSQPCPNLCFNDQNPSLKKYFYQYDGGYNCDD